MEHEPEKLTRPLPSRTANRLRQASHRQAGVALVIALGFLVLIAIIVLAFFQSVTTEYSTARTYSDGATTRFLADSATNLVMGQIVKATKPQATGATTRLTWASQPGMIRTYDDTGANRDCYKLYSSGQMVIGSTNVMSALAADIPSGWNTLPANYTDLNAPVTDYTGKLNFPIVDGNLKTVTVNGVNSLTYDDNGDGVPDIEGFSIPTASVPTYDSSAAISDHNNPAPMPVQWLYVLQDGSIAAPDTADPGTTSAKATFATAANKPSATNPIVGRIAFWADDETSKLNINTAAEGSYYAFPHTNTPTEMLAPSKTFGFATSPPANGEYNRYPGHPASTCLSVALGTWLDNPSGKLVPTAYTSTDSSYLSGLANYLSLSPRNALGGSLAGTADGTTYSTVTLDTDRMFSSVDELMFNPARTPFNSQLTNTALNRLKFFLTASSRAPELTPFNTPKVSLFPQWGTLADRMAPAGNTGSTSGARAKSSASLLAFCSSFGQGAASPSGKFEYFFERANGTSWKSTIQDWNNVPRNQQLANYLYNLGNTPIPGYGGTFVSKYRTNGVSTYPNIVVESLDFIRSNVGKITYITKDGTTGNTEQYIAPLVVSSNLPGASATTPIKGFGDYAICTQVVLSVGYVPPVAPATTGTPTPFLGFEFFVPTQSFPGSNPGIDVVISNTGNFGIKPQTGKPALPTSIRARNFGFFNGGDMFTWYNNKTSTMRVYMWALSGYTIDDSGTSLSIGSNSPVTITFQDQDNPPNVIQQIAVKFPVTTIPKPTTNNSSISNGNYYDFAADAYSTMTACSARGVECSATGPLKGDWRLLGTLWNVPSAGRGGVDYFTPAAQYTTTSVQQAHSLRPFVGGALDGSWAYNAQPIRINGLNSSPPTTSVAGTLTKILKNTDYEDYQAPCTPVGLTGDLVVNSLGKPGDWDTGPGLMPDGPYVNPTEQYNNVGLTQYFSQNPGSNAISASYSPNRLVASPVKFGSLPTGSNNSTSPQPWQTLLFCPNPAARSVAAGNAGITSNDRAALAAEHPGFATPPDHLYLEFFTMPTVEPYAISEPLSTAGKVNLNYQMAPFTYIERSTALRGVFKNTLLTGISGNDIAWSGTHPTPSNNGTSKPRYKFESNGTAGVRYPNETRYDINRDATIAGLEEHYFNQGNLFRYPSEICNLFLVPQKLSGATYMGAAPPTNYDDMMAWWTGSTSSLSTMAMTGDNLREEPYDHLYPRLTTKSNSYTVHFRVQTLKKRTATDPTIWQEGQDVVTGEYRGSSLIERYIDPNDPQLNANWDNDSMLLNLNGTADLSHLYKFRVVSTKKFAP